MQHCAKGGRVRVTRVYESGGRRARCLHAGDGSVSAGSTTAGPSHQHAYGPEESRLAEKSRVAVRADYSVSLGARELRQRDRLGRADQGQPRRTEIRNTVAEVVLRAANVSRPVRVEATLDRVNSNSITARPMRSAWVRYRSSVSTSARATNDAFTRQAEGPAVVLRGRVHLRRLVRTHNGGGQRCPVMQRLAADRTTRDHGTGRPRPSLAPAP
jgi:hypothetical protein